jgi:protein associated with RNAse G/E
VTAELIPDPTAQPVRVVYRKYDGALHWNFTMYRLGADEHGDWLGVPANCTSRRGTEPPVVFAEPYALLVPDGHWWTAMFNDPPARTEIYCDITTVPQWTSPAEVTMVDLDLDVIRRRDGTVFIDDEDEFTDHQVRYAYPPDVIAAARRSADDLLTRVRANAEPFATTHRDWLTLARALTTG